jgi:hypothetical protein
MISEPGVCCKIGGKEIRASSHWRELPEKPVDLARITHESYPFDRECKVNI